MKKTTSLLLAVLVAGSVFTASAMADAKHGKRFYQHHLHICKKDGLKNGVVFALKHNRREWTKLEESGKILDEWKTICPHATKKFNKMKPIDVNNLYDFCWKYASDGDIPSCGG